MESLTDQKNFIPVSMALETLYCPRNFYLRYITGEERRDAKMERGFREDERRNYRKKISLDSAERIHDVSLVSFEKGLTGKVDAVENRRGEFIPFEYKTGKISENEYDRAQLCAYGMMLEEMKGLSIPYGCIYYMEDRRKIKIVFDESLRARVNHAVETAWAILEGSLVPPPRDDPRCRGCALADVCMPDETRIMSGMKDECPSGVAPRSTFERTVFIDQSWGSIGCSGGQLTITRGSERIGEVPLEQFDQLFLIGKINVSGSLLSELLKRDVFIAFFTSFGRFEGSLIPEKSRHSALRIHQVQASIDETHRLGVAREIVDAKLINMRVMLRRANQRTPAEILETSINQIAALRRQLQGADTFEQLLGIEGAGSRAYFEGYRSLFDQSWEFERRTRRPPTDPVNAALSFGYSILTGQVSGLINAVGMDPYIGFLHREHYGHPCLALDLMEPFRSIIVDSTVLRMFHQNMLTRSCFTKPDAISGAVYLNDSGRKAFFNAFSTRMQEQATHPVFKKKLSYRRLIEMDIRFLAKHLCGEFDRFSGYTVR
jgi:CRISP-associated protein Cas1